MTDIDKKTYWRDAFGNDISVGDTVAYTLAHRRQYLQTGVVLRFGARQVSILPDEYKDREDLRGISVAKYPSAVARRGY